LKSGFGGLRDPDAMKPVLEVLATELERDPDAVAFAEDSPLADMTRRALKSLTNDADATPLPSAIPGRCSSWRN